MKEITLRAIEPEDIDAIFRWENDPSLWESSESHAPFSRHLLKSYIANSIEQDIFASREARLMAYDGVVAVGCADLFRYDPFHCHAELGVLVDSAFRRMGYGTAMVNALIEYCRDALHIHSLTADIAADNMASIRLFERCGFSRVGVKKEHLKLKNNWIDVFIYQIII